MDRPAVRVTEEVLPGVPELLFQLVPSVTLIFEVVTESGAEGCAVGPSLCCEHAD
jgi:hypothetical protein